MKYLVTNPNLKGETLLTGASHKRLDTALRKATNAGIRWTYGFLTPFLLLENAPDGLEMILGQYGTVRKFKDDEGVPYDA